MWCDVLNDYTFNQRQRIDRCNKIHAEVVAHTDVGHNGDITLIKGQAFSQNPTARCFKYCGIDIGVHQDIARTARSTAISSVNAAVLNINAI